MYGSINLYFQMSGEHYHPPHIPPVFLYITFRVPFDYKTGSFKLTNQTHKHHIHHTIKRKIFFFSFVGCVIWYIVQLYDGIYRDSDSDILFMFFFCNVTEINKIYLYIWLRHIFWFFLFFVYCGRLKWRTWGACLNIGELIQHFRFF